MCTASTSTTWRIGGPRRSRETWDLLLLWLVQLHGGNGMRTIIADYSRKDSTKFWLNTVLALSIAFTLVLGTYVLLTFDATIS